MGQKVHPAGFRVGVINNWNSRWYASKADFANKLYQDVQIRNMILNKMSTAYISHIDIERTSNKVRVIIYSGRPGMLIGRQGSQIDFIKEKVQTILSEQVKLFVDIKEVKNPSLDAKIVSDSIAFQLEKRVAFRRAMKKVLQSVKDANGEGIKIKCSGRLAGAEIARSEGYKWGKIPLQTIRADIDYGFSEARTSYGIIGVKVWIYKGEKFKSKLKKQEPKKTKKNKEK